ncbi:hypothetical protein KFU94_32885 [Chloroflexi bacterium TSY]|nr:hypothetical protein [Chloroflexi bacterium TSY]
MNHRLGLDESATYQITVQGYVSQRWADHLGLSIICMHQPDWPITTLVGTVIDQAALMGILSSLYGMGFPLLMIKCEMCPESEKEN